MFVPRNYRPVVDGFAVLIEPKSLGSSLYLFITFGGQASPLHARPKSLNFLKKMVDAPGLEPGTR